MYVSDSASLSTPAPPPGAHYYKIIWSNQSKRMTNNKNKAHIMQKRYKIQGLDFNLPYFTGYRTSSRFIFSFLWWSQNDHNSDVYNINSYPLSSFDAPCFNRLSAVLAVTVTLASHIRLIKPLCASPHNTGILFMRAPARTRGMCFSAGFQTVIQIILRVWDLRLSFMRDMNKYLRWHQFEYDF